MPIDVRSLGADFVVASGHKMAGPTGIGFLWAPLSLLETIPPWQGGGDMIDEVFETRSTWAPPPARFEAGTPAIAEVIGLGAACDYLARVGMGRVHAHEQELAGALHQALARLPGCRVYGPAPGAASPRGRAALAAFTVDGVHATDLSTLLDHNGVAIRTGHHCTQPLHRELKVPLFASARASAYLYTTQHEVQRDLCIFSPPPSQFSRLFRCEGCHARGHSMLILRTSPLPLHPSSRGRSPLCRSTSLLRR